MAAMTTHQPRKTQLIGANSAMGDLSRPVCGFMVAFVQIQPHLPQIYARVALGLGSLYPERLWEAMAMACLSQRNG